MLHGSAYAPLHGRRPLWLFSKSDFLGTYERGVDRIYPKMTHHKSILSDYARFGLNTANMHFCKVAPNKCQSILRQLSAGCDMFSQVMANGMNQSSISLGLSRCKRVHDFPKFGSEQFSSISFRIVPHAWASCIAVLKHQYSKTSGLENQVEASRK